MLIHGHIPTYIQETEKACHTQLGELAQCAHTWAHT